MEFGFSDKEEEMKCVICKQGETVPGQTTVTMERDQLTLVIKGVPAQVCENCGEAYTGEKTTHALLEIAKDAVSKGVQVDVREYVAA